MCILPKICSSLESNTKWRVRAGRTNSVSYEGWHGWVVWPQTSVTAQVNNKVKVTFAPWPLTPHSMSLYHMTLPSFYRPPTSDKQLVIHSPVLEETLVGCKTITKSLYFQIILLTIYSDTSSARSHPGLRHMGSGTGGSDLPNILQFLYLQPFQSSQE